MLSYCNQVKYPITITKKRILTITETIPKIKNHLNYKAKHEYACPSIILKTHEPLNVAKSSLNEL